MLTIERERPGQTLNYVFGKIQLPRVGGSASRELKFGWDTSGYPAATTDGRTISPYGQDMARKIRLTTFPLEEAQADYTPVASEFAAYAKPFDRPDQGNQFTEDTLNIAVTNEVGAVSFIKVKELDLLKSILVGQIETVIGRSKSYTLLIPDDETQKLHILLFSPGNHSSNEFKYRTFLLNTITTLAGVDRNQNPPDQKGYVAVFRAAIKAAVDNKVGTYEATGAEKVAIKLGILKQMDLSGNDRFTYFTVEQFRYVIQRFNEVVGARFARGKV